MSQQGGVEDPERFGARVLEYVRWRPGVLRAEFDRNANEVRVRMRSNALLRIELGVLYRRCNGVFSFGALADIDNLLAVHKRPSDWEQAAPRLRPVLRRCDYLDFTFEGMRGRDLLLARPALPHLAEMLVLTMPRTIEFVTTQDLEAWDVDADTAFATAHANLATLALNTMEAFTPSDEVRVLEFEDKEGDSYVGSLPLIAGWLEGVATRTGTRPLVFLPAHVGMLVVLGATGDLVVQAQALAEERFAAAVRPLSPVPYTVGDDGELVPLQVPEDHPAWETLRKAKQQLATGAGGRGDGSLDVPE